MLAIQGYHILQKLHSGLHTATYRGLRLHDQKKVIIKLTEHLYPTHKEIALLQHEYQLLKQIHAPGIICVYDLIEVDLAPVLILEDIDGQSLSEFLAGKPLDLATFFHLALQFSDILGQLHQQNIIHKDIKPVNTIIHPQSLLIKLTDFSISSQLSEEAQNYLSPYLLEGSYAYLSPEQTGRMNCAIDYRTDFYSLGVTFFEMLTGKLPFQAQDPSEWVHCHIAKLPPLVTEFKPDIPPQLAAIINKLLAKTPAKRYASSVGLKADLLICKKLWEQRKINLFTLGQHDVHDHLRISPKLYGREEQITQLLTAFEHVSGGHTQLLLVSGYSGIGKTALIREVHKPIVQHRGYFVAAKFDQLQRSTPYSAIVQAFKELTYQLLTEPEEKINKFRADFARELENIGQVIVEVLPELKHIVGVQPPVPELAAMEAQNRFNFAFEKFIQLIANAEHPLVIFLDDLQWVDSASLKLIETFLTHSANRYFLLIGAYRSNEVAADHPLLTSVQNLTQAQVNIESIALQPLQLIDIQALLADTFNCKLIETEILAKWIQEKTLGNPFFISEFLKTLCQKKCIEFSYAKGQWQWDIDAIQQQMVTANVVSLLTEKINTLTQSTQEILKLAACIGYQFDLQSLSIISRKNFPAVAHAIWEAMQISLLIPMEETYQTAYLANLNQSDPAPKTNNLHYIFVHDKVQQAAYELIPPLAKQKFHLRIGRLLLKEKSLIENPTRLFEIMDQFNHGLGLIRSFTEKKKIAQYNLLAGKKAKLSNAYQAALNYLTAGIKLLEPLDWQQEPTLIFSLIKEYAVCKFLVGEFELAEQHFNLLLQHTKTSLEKVEIYRLKIEMLSTLNKHQAAMQLGLHALHLLGITIPSKPNIFHIIKIVLAIKIQIGRKKVTDIDLPAAIDAKFILASELLSRLCNNAFFLNQKLFLMLVSTNIHLSLKHGYTEDTFRACLGYAIALIHTLQWYTEGIFFVELYEQARKNHPEINFSGRYNFISGSFIDPWRFPARGCLQTLSESQHLLCNIGEISYGNYCNIVLIITSSMLGQSLENIRQYIMRAEEYSLRAKAPVFQQIINFYRYIMDCLADNAAFDVNKINAFEQAILKTANNTEINIFYSQMIKLCYFFGDFFTAQQAIIQHRKYYPYAKALLSTAEAAAYSALALLALYPTASNIQKAHLLKKILRILQEYRRWAKWCPANFLHYLLLLEAEIAQIKNNMPAAINFYEQALVAAKKQDAILSLALINERAGRYYKKLNLIKFAKLYITEAEYIYRCFGAENKCKSLANEFLQWNFSSNENSLTQPSNIFTTIGQTTAITTQSIDMVAILKSMQIISSEIQLKKLLTKLLRVVLENAGAQRCLLLLKENNIWRVEADSTLTEQQIYLNQSIPINTRIDLPLSLLQYMQRTPEPIIIQEATQAPQTMHDPYIMRVQPKSLLVMPIHYQGQLRRILYLEHYETPGTFTAQHLQGLQLLITQAAISLENAYLYYQATHDPLTGLANRNLLYQTFSHIAEQVKTNQQMIAILFMDLDHFKRINDTLGHEIGDAVLIYVAEQLKTCLREGDIAVRLGGDEFVIMLTGIEEFTQIKMVADRLYKCFVQKIYLQGHALQLSSSMGISLYPNDGADIQILLKQADIALYRAKENGRNYYEYYSPSLNQTLREHYHLASELQQALDQQQLCLYYQPIYNIQNGHIISLEPLIRWQHPHRGLLTADQIIPLAEQTGLIIPIGEWVLRTACKQVKIWQEKKLAIVPISVNLSALQLKHISISQLVSTILIETQLDAVYLELELTESNFLEDTTKIQHELQMLKAKGIKLAVDDFGTGYSSFAYLKRLPFNKLKIDQSFIQDIPHDHEHAVIMLAIIKMAHQLNMQVIAEGVETSEQYEFLREHQVDAIQGYYFKEPIDVLSCEALLTPTRTKQ